MLQVEASINPHGGKHHPCNGPSTSTKDFDAQSIRSFDTDSDPDTDPDNENQTMNQVAEVTSANATGLRLQCWENEMKLIDAIVVSSVKAERLSLSWS